MAKNTTIHRIQIEGTSDLIKLRKELDGYQQSLKKVKKEKTYSSLKWIQTSLVG